ADTASRASPGQQYLLMRKLDTERKAELRVITARVVGEIVDRLRPSALAVVRSPIPRVAAGDVDPRGSMVLNAAFLVAPGSVQPFQVALTALVGEYTSAGFRFDFTGPWPPY